ncbi:MAG TPA: DUF6048 family protein [Flavobacteriaceae bacterium]
MKTRHTSFYIISILIMMLCAVTSFSQNDSIAKDSAVYKQHYGLRLGGDVSKLVRSFLDDDYKGFEVNGDYRLTHKLYLAGELGFEEKTTSTDYLTTTAKGSYFKAGVDYNLYTNWLDMENMIYGGFRVGASTFNQTLNSFTVYNTDQYWQQQYADNPNQEFNGLSAIWAELVFGIKAQVLSHLYVGFNVQLKGMITQDEPENFANLWVPGFNKIYDSGRIGVGFGYNISYLIPIYKKNKVVAPLE